MIKKIKYKNIILAIISIIFAIILSKNEAFHSLIISLGRFSYFGVFVAGIFFVSMFTVAPSILALMIFAETINPLTIGLIAGLGAVVGDLLIFHFVKDHLFDEILEIYHLFDNKKHIYNIFQSKYGRWFLTIIGAIIIASPFPDEIGLSLMGLSKINTGKFIILVYFLDAIGIFLLISASLAIRNI